MNSFKMKLQNYILLCSVAVAFFLHHSSYAQDHTFRATLSLKEMFDPAKDNISGGIIGNVSSGGYIQVEVFKEDLSQPNNKGTLMYLVNLKATSVTFSGNNISYNNNGDIPNTSGGGWTDYYPTKWKSDDIKSSVFALDEKRYYNTGRTSIGNLLVTPIKVIIKVFTVNATFIKAKIPGIGIVSSTGGNLIFDASHFCSDITNTDHPACRTWNKIKTPNIEKTGTNLMLAAHRGYWGYNLGTGPPENTPDAIQAALSYTKIIESDIMRTADNKMVVSHDYNLHRLTNYNGPDTEYIFNKNLSELTSLRLKRRNETLSESHFITFAQLLDQMIAKNTVLTVDIKGARPRLNPYTKVCEARCNYDPRENTNAKELQKQDFMLILRKCIEIANQKNALHYIALKTTYKYSDIVEGMPTGFDRTLLEKVLYFPVIQPGGEVSKKVKFIDDWHNNAGKRVMGYETNFKNYNESYLSSFTSNGKEYKNLLHYVYDRTGLRPGMYPEEAVGPKGIVDRWAHWIIKDARTDLRGDHYYLMSIPYFKISILTTDRPDIWNHIGGIMD